MRGLGGHGRGIVAALAAAGLGLVAAACGPASGSTGAGAGGSVPSSNGGTTVTYAMPPGGIAGYPFPMIPATNQTAQWYSVYNSNDFQFLLYRPLYWFGTGVNPYLNPHLSLAEPATYQGQQVTIHLKPTYKWSNGEDVDAQDVVFWLHMMQAVGSGEEDFGGPNALPDGITNVRAPSKYVVTMHIKAQKFSESWFSDNELSEIIPMPMAWDRTASGPSNCVQQVSACLAVFNYLNQQSLKSPGTFASSPLWSVVDGPWKIQTMDGQGNVTLAFNNRYSGPVAPHHITKFVEVPFTSQQAEYNVLQDPTGSQAIDVGYLPTVDAPVPPAGASVGANSPSLPNYELSSFYSWALQYFPYNFNNPAVAPIFNQLYFRQAFQSLVDQEGVIAGPQHGYGQATIGPVSDFPVTSYLSPELKKHGDVWTLNISKAKSLLASHGWKLVKGTQTCTSPGNGPTDCGKGIHSGQQLKFSLIYATGDDALDQSVRELASNASLAGITLDTTAETFGAVTQMAFGGPQTQTQWQLADWGGWQYWPDNLPTGEVLFESGVPNNAGGYSNDTNNQLINDTLDARTPAAFSKAMNTWQDYLAGQLPVVWEPSIPNLLETIKGLDIGPQNSALSIMPELWHYGQ